MSKPKIAIISFPGTNGDTENLRALWRTGFDAQVFRWNDSTEKLKDFDVFFIGAGFSYEDRGRSGMVAGRDMVCQFLHEQARSGKVVIGNCNGAQILVESELIPLGSGLKMSLARNLAQTEEGSEAVGFLNRWVWIKRTCKPDRCATSHWDGVMHVPIAHGEGRFVTRDKEVIEELRRNDQIAFSYCASEGVVTDRYPYCPNGSLFAAAGICNTEGNVVALMPHPERTLNGDVYFHSIHSWLTKRVVPKEVLSHNPDSARQVLKQKSARDIEIFIDTLIVNNEERTVEQAASRLIPKLTLRQLKYLSPIERSAEEILQHISCFNPNKEVAYIRVRGKFFRWNASMRKREPISSPLTGICLLRRDEPDTASKKLGPGAQTGTCYVCQNVDEGQILKRRVLEIFANPHASTLERIV